MNLTELLKSWFTDHYQLWIVSLGSATLGVVSGALGTYAVLRRQSLLGDAVSHAALPGIVLTFILFHSKESLLLVAGAMASGWIATLLVMSVVRATRIKYDTALASALSVFFGLGLLLLAFSQKNIPDANQAGLDKWLFGQAAVLKIEDDINMAVLGTTALAIMAIFWKEFKLLSFDPDFGASLGFPMRFLDVLLTGLLVVAIVIGLQAVGVVLMSAMVVAPAAAARQWTDRLGRMVFLAAFFGALAGVGGGIISSSFSRVSTGPVIVLCLGVLVVLSLTLAPRRGLIWARVRHWRSRRQLRLEAVLSDLYALAAQHEGQEHGHSLAVLRAMSAGGTGVDRNLQELSSRGWARQVAADQWTLTPAGRAEAERRARIRDQHHV